MSWLSGSLSNFTGQLTNLTKDILSEGTAEIEDLPSELKLSYNKINELENLLTNQKYENNRLTVLCEELQLKNETNEIRLSHVHENYREILAEREAEINDLTEQLFNERNNLSLIPTKIKTSSSSQQLKSATWPVEHMTVYSSQCDFASEDNDFGNIEYATIDLNNQTPQTQLSASVEYDVKQLMKKNQELEKQLIALDELRQSELLAIQSNYEIKLAALNSANNELLHKQKESFDQQIAEWNQKIAEVQQKVSSNATSEGWDTCDWNEEESNSHLECPGSPIISLETDKSQTLEEQKPDIHNDINEIIEINEKLKDDLKQVSYERDILRKHPILNMYESFRDPELQELFLETFSLYRHDADENITRNLIKRCQDILVCEMKDGSCQYELDDYDSDTLEKASSTLSHDVSSTFQDLQNQLDEHVKHLSLQIDNYEHQVIDLVQKTGDFSYSEMKEMNSLKQNIQNRLNALREVGFDKDRISQGSESTFLLVDVLHHGDSHTFKDSFTETDVNVNENLEKAIFELLNEMNDRISSTDVYVTLNNIRLQFCQYKSQIESLNTLVSETEKSMLCYQEDCIKLSKYIQTAFESHDPQYFDKFYSKNEEFQNILNFLTPFCPRKEKNNDFNVEILNEIYLKFGNQWNSVKSILLQQESNEEYPNTLPDFAAQFHLFCQDVEELKRICDDYSSQINQFQLALNVKEMEMEQLVNKNINVEKQNEIDRMEFAKKLEDFNNQIQNYKDIINENEKKMQLLVCVEKTLLEKEDKIQQLQLLLVKREKDEENSETVAVSDDARDGLGKESSENKSNSIEENKNIIVEDLDLKNQIELLTQQLDEINNTKENLEKELLFYKQNWEELVVSLKQKHEESQCYYNQLQELSVQSQQDLQLVQMKLAQVEAMREVDYRAYTELSDQYKKLITAVEHFCDTTFPNTSDNNDLITSALTNKQKDINELQLLVKSLTENEKRLTVELNRLRNHLLEMEETCTNEAIAAENREEELRRKLLAIEEVNNSTVNNNELRLQELIVNVKSLEDECDTAWSRVHEQDSLLSKSNNEINILNEQLKKLQNVLVTFQEDRESSIRLETEHMRRDMSKLKEILDQHEQRNVQLESQLATQNEIVDAARRLTQQIQRLENDVQHLQEIVDEKNRVINLFQKEINEKKETEQGKIDKILMKNLLVGYFHTPTNKRADALRVIGSLLHFTNEDFIKIGVDIGGRSGWFNWLKSDLNNPITNIVPNSDGSFSELFIKFLERESLPEPMLKLPTEEIAAIASSKARNRSSVSFSSTSPVSNPLLAAVYQPTSSVVSLPYTSTSSTSTSACQPK